jgi:hypothetical protein
MVIDILRAGPHRVRVNRCDSCIDEEVLILYKDGSNKTVHLDTWFGLLMDWEETDPRIDVSSAIRCFRVNTDIFQEMKECFEAREKIKRWTTPQS